MYKYNTISDVNDLMRRIGCFNKTQLDTQMHKAYINESLDNFDEDDPGISRYLLDESLKDAWDRPLRI